MWFKLMHLGFNSGRQEPMTISDIAMQSYVQVHILKTFYAAREELLTAGLIDFRYRDDAGVVGNYVLIPPSDIFLVIEE